MSRLLSIALLLFVGLPVAGAQSTTAANPQPATGWVTGHVVCGDTQRPARLAEVRLVPAEARKSSKAGGPAFAAGQNVSPVETDFTGAYTVRGLRPGRYVLRVNLDGYITPLPQFDGKQMEQPDAGTQQRMAAELVYVDVRPQAEARADITLQRGAVIAGAVRYDDGSPAIGLGVSLLAADDANGWRPVQYTYANTDGRGRYHFNSVEPGKYLVQANLSLNEFSNSVMSSPTGDGTIIQMSMQKTVFSLPIYSGDALRKTQATPIAVDAGAETDGNDITIPISKLHQVSGQVLGPGGQTVNAGKVSLLWKDDGSEVASIDISRNDRQFVLPYVPEGSFTLKVENPREVTTIEVPNAAGTQLHLREQEKVVQRFGASEQPLVLTSDTQGVVMRVPEAAPTAAQAGSH